MVGSKKPGGSRAPPAKDQSKSATATERPKSNASSTTSVLLELPPELRNKIFRYALISNKPIKLQFSSGRWHSKRRRFTMLPELISVSKQLRSETQRIFFEDNTFEITPEILKQRSQAPLLFLRTMHCNLGLQLRSVSVCQETKVSIQKILFQLKASFTISMNARGSLTITRQEYSGTYIGRSLPIAPHLGVCGCGIANLLLRFNNIFRGCDIVQFLLLLKDHNRYFFRSCHLRDLIRKGEVVYESRYCQECRGQGWRRVAF